MSTLFLSVTPQLILIPARPLPELLILVPTGHDYCFPFVLSDGLRRYFLKVNLKNKAK